MRLALVISFALALLAAPLAAAQVPVVPNAVALVCSTVAGEAPQVSQAIPACPDGDPQAPPPPGPTPDPANASANGTVNATVDATHRITQDAQDAAQAIVNDPTSAPDRLAVFLDEGVTILKELLGVPRAAGLALADAADVSFHALSGSASTVTKAATDAVHGAVRETGDAIAAGGRTAAHAVRGSLSAVAAAVAHLFAHGTSTRDGDASHALTPARGLAKSTRGLIPRIVTPLG